MQLVSLLYRYLLLYMPTSAVKICKVTHTGFKASFGLEACRPIKAGTFIKETCSSMSVDTVPEGGISVIEAIPSQTGPPGLRSILGPFRMVNHDCNPNCKVSANNCCICEVFKESGITDLCNSGDICVRGRSGKEHSNWGRNNSEVRKWVLWKQVPMQDMHQGGPEGPVRAEAKV